MYKRLDKKQVVVLFGLPLLALSLFFMVPDTWGHVPPGATLVEGRMTGGGSIFTGPDDLINGQANPGSEIRITHGFELHCSADVVPNNLEINIHPNGGAGSRFKVDTLTWAACWDDPEIDPTPPAAPFDHYFGRAVGSYNGQSGYCAQWLFTDAGERGTEDRIEYMLIWTGDGCSAGDPTAPYTGVLSIPEPGHPLTFGNHQAHKENK